MKPFRDDGDATEISMFAFGNNCEVKIYTKSKPIIGNGTFMDKVREKGKWTNCDQEVESFSKFEGESSDKCVKDVHFDDTILFT